MSVLRTRRRFCSSPTVPAVVLLPPAAPPDPPSVASSGADAFGPANASRPAGALATLLCAPPDEPDEREPPEPPEQPLTSPTATVSATRPLAKPADVQR